MQIPTEIHYRGLDPSPAVDQYVQKWIDRMGRVYDRVHGCSVTIDVPHRHQERGRKFHVSIVLEVPGQTLSVNRDPGADEAHDNAYVAIRDAFRAARRQLEEHAEIVRSTTATAEA